ncbi:deleted in malignant brain tumors 1 protein-like [Heterodontus francisci]|uniref:deleted in malignant brain tumors 1 protein-like n=1 Tax=Heterodontus francisci TaxID=7792 RepID=UPI00355C450C
MGRERYIPQGKNYSWGKGKYDAISKNVYPVNGRTIDRTSLTGKRIRHVGEGSLQENQSSSNLADLGTVRLTRQVEYILSLSPSGSHWSLCVGCGTAVLAPGWAHFGEGTGPVVMADVECSGTEAALRDCESDQWDQYSWPHSDDAGVICSGKPELRLVGGMDRCSGRVEVRHAHQWGTLCDLYFDMEDAKVVCEHLQCGAVNSIPEGARFGKGTGAVWKENYRCLGNETRLWDCPVSSWEQFSFSHENDAGVICTDHVQLTLSDGGSPCTGRVEIYYNGTWGSVCDDSWDLADADVVCKQLGCGKALDMALPASCGPGSGPVWLDELKCSSNESFLWKCPSASWGNHDCSHKEDVRVMCSEHKELQLVNGKHRCEGRVEVFYNGTWGTVCSDTFDGPDAEVICKQLQCGPLCSIDYYTQSFGEGSGTIWLDGMKCISHESFLWQCQTEPWGKHNCEHRDDAGVVCSEANVAKEQLHRSEDCIREYDCKRVL